MNPESNKFWRQIAKGLARRTGHAPMTPEEAQKEFESLPDEKLADDQIEDIVERVTSGEFTDWTPATPEFDAPEFDCESIDEDVLQLNRNEGAADAEADELLNELRRKALEDGHDDGQEDTTGMGGDQEPPRQGD